MSDYDMTITEYLDSIGARMVATFDGYEDSPYGTRNKYVCRFTDCDGNTFDAPFTGSVVMAERGELPKRDDVFECLLMDAAAYGDAGDMGGMADMFGIDKPSEAIRIWTACQQTYLELCGFLGESELARILDGEVQW